MATVINGTTGVDKVQDGSITPEDLQQKMTLMTAQTASGTSVDFTGIPSWAKRITVMFNGVSLSGTSNILLQIGDSGGIENTGYAAGVVSAQNTTTSSAGISSTSGFPVTDALTAGYFVVGAVRLLTFDSTNGWVEEGCLQNTTANRGMVSGGSKTLSSTLDRVRITTVNGTDTFDAGTINIMYEG